LLDEMKTLTRLFFRSVFRGSHAAIVALIASLAALGATSAATPDITAQPAPEASSPRSRKPAATSLATRGQQVFGQHCAFCHGADARGGAQGGSDLLQSPIVLEDEGGAGLGKFLAVGRPEKNMPKFDLPRQRIAELAAFLHARIGTARSSKFKVDPLVGDPKAGAAYFNGPGRCTTCHSVTGNGDLARIGAKYDPVRLQGRMVVPRGRGGWPGGDENAGDLPLRATVTLPSGQTVSGDVLYLSDFHVTVKDASGKRHTISRSGDGGDVPKVEIVDPLHAHVAMLRTLSDKSMHDLTAYLATLK
jgi:cytochrome c oxidase cbb3-type subunit 3